MEEAEGRRASARGVRGMQGPQRRRELRCQHAPAGHGERFTTVGDDTKHFETRARSVQRAEHNLHRIMTVHAYGITCSSVAGGRTGRPQSAPAKTLSVMSSGPPRAPSVRCLLPR